MQQSEKFFDFLKENSFIQGFKMKKESLKPHKLSSPRNRRIPKQDDFFGSLTTCVDYFEISRKKRVASVKTDFTVVQEPKVEEFSERNIINSFQKTTRESELKQQKKILFLHNRIHMLTKDIDDLKRGNSELFTECKIQKETMKNHEVKKQGFEEYKTQQEKMISIMKTQIDDNEAFLKDLKPIINFTLEDLDRMALSQARREVKQKAEEVIKTSEIQPTEQSQHFFPMQKTQASQSSINLKSPGVKQTPMTPLKSINLHK